MSDPISAEKQAARVAALARRDAAFATPGTAARVAAANAHLVDYLAARPEGAVSGYMAIRSELSPLAAMTALVPLRPVCVPVIRGRDLPLVFHAWRPGIALERGPFGAMVPRDGIALVPRYLIVPLAAADAFGNRLGYGGGYYDRTLAILRSGPAPVEAIGLAFAGQIVARLPVEPTDQRLDLLITEAGVTRFGDLP